MVHKYVVGISMDDDYRAVLKAHALDEQTFIKLTMSGIVRGPAVAWHKIVVRPVLIKHGWHLQFSYFDQKRDISKNYRGEAAAAQLDEALAIPFSSIQLQSTLEDIHVQLTKKGKVLLHRSRPAHAGQQPELEHNRAKALPLPAAEAVPLLQALGIANQQGEVKPSMQGKFAQINEFLKLLSATGELERIERSPLTILDCGCGSAYLTFATYHYLNTIRGIPARLIGVDLNAELIQKCRAISEQLGIADAQFEQVAIIDAQPAAAPDIVLALHACDTASDEAIAQAIRQQSHMLLCVPCCHHDLNQQIAADLFRPVLRHGILKQRMADILTDSLRALALRIMGYRTEVIEFISNEHTARNLMIRAVRTTAPGDQSFVQEYTDLKRFWNVTPYIEKLLGEEFTRFF